MSQSLLCDLRIDRLQQKKPSSDIKDKVKLDYNEQIGTRGRINRVRIKRRKQPFGTKIQKYYFS